jgi:hypothetical protein
MNVLLARIARFNGVPGFGSPFSEQCTRAQNVHTSRPKWREAVIVQLFAREDHAGLPGAARNRSIRMF